MTPDDIVRKIAALRPWERVDFDERAGIRQYDGGYPRAQAESLAYEDIVKRREGGMKIKV